MQTATPPPGSVWFLGPWRLMRGYSLREYFTQKGRLVKDTVSPTSCAFPRSNGPVQQALGVAGNVCRSPMHISSAP